MKRTRYTKNEFIVDGDICHIQLYNRDQNIIGEALIDRKDMRMCRSYKWSLNGSGYVGAKIKGKSVFLHNHITGVNGSYLTQVDHKNRVRTDCRRGNLRESSSCQNKMNRVNSKVCSSIYRGVSFDRKSGKWRVSVNANNKQYYIGLFGDEVVAAQAFDEVAVELQGDFAILNFPDVGEVL